MFVGDVTQYTDELAQDAVGNILTDTNSIDLTYNDAGNSISADVKVRNTTTTNTSVTASGLGVDVNNNTSIQRVEVVKNSGSVVGTRKQLNFIEGSNVALTISDDSVNDQVDITISSTGGGAGSLPQVTTLTDTTNNLSIIGISQIIRIDPSANNVQCFLPTAVGNTGYIFWIKRVTGGLNTAIINTTSSQTIDGVLSASLTVLNEAIGIYSNGIGWEII